MTKIFLLPVILQLLGILVTIAEIILPSAGILSIMATCLFGYSLYLVYTEISPLAGTVFVLADILIIPVLIYTGLKFLARSPATLNTILSSKDGVTSQSSDQQQYLGCQGYAITDLRPSGAAHINDERLDVVTRGEYIEKQTEITVIAVKGNQIIVKRKEDDITPSGD